VKICIARFHVAWPYSEGPPDIRRLDPWVELKPGEFVQGALIVPKIGEPRVYVVTVPPPTHYEEIASPWPRIVGVCGPPIGTEPSPRLSQRRMPNP
jgi:hypothetical protein